MVKSEDGRAAEASFDELRPVHHRQDHEHVGDAEDVVVLEWTLVALPVVGGVDLPQGVTVPQVAVRVARIVFHSNGVAEHGGRHERELGRSPTCEVVVPLSLRICGRSS